MSNFSNVSRRRFITLAGASAGAVFLKGCLGNPPDTLTGRTSSAVAVPVANLQPEEVPEVTTAKLGYLPIVEAAPLIVAKEKGFFAKYGMPEVQISKQANWGSARDNVKIGSGGGGVDGGQWQMPMPYLISEGIITDNVKVPMYVLAQLNTQGNGIAIGNKHLGKGLSLKIADQAKVFSQLKAEGSKFKAAYTFPKVNQDFWIRYWLAGNGIDPDAEVELLTVPTAQTVADMKRGAMDAFSTGDPWPQRIVADRTGFVAALTGEIWKNHPEEYLAIRKDWVDQNPKATKAILKAVMEAQQWCDNFDNRQELAAILAQREYFGIPEAVLIDPLMGKYNLGERTVDDKTLAPLYWKDEKGSVSYPYQSHDLWFLTESVRWGFLPKDTLSKAPALIKQVNREDIWREAAKELGVATADIPTSTSRGVEEFFDGTTFDPKNPQAYLDSLKIKRS
ncbi:CmpA/NrtA family ABC transporter substrate-binding protein [Leptolyngbya sp. FACHB-261]|uniref:CmpA/NrtA family ABC transporter substrate-binding protein n=1 Tax=Leptolyngbya sp. FACHB-261 TaxID=2692806 RepID=UPI0016879985|nr:CmpA/NrtA family ABC transporter substrate-binding protein [Leptolyngbya sp. FACHB-261]MBD2102689.1 ABC transporter substrate-binding protein [Leptolyngbya sp. FACHB-261]